MLKNIIETCPAMCGKKVHRGGLLTAILGIKQTSNIDSS